MLAKLVWDGIKLFFELEFLGYDPLGNTLPTFEFNNTMDFQLYRNFELIQSQINSSSTEKNENNSAVFSILKQKILEEVNMI